MLGMTQRVVTGSGTGPPDAQATRAWWRYAAFALVLALYVLLTFAVVVRSHPVMWIDDWVADLRMKHRWPGFKPWIDVYIRVGQRAPSTLVALPWILWRARRLQSNTPVVRLVVALLLLNLSVGVVKVTTGRIGPHKISRPDAIFAGGNIYPSGHVSNIVVLLGVLSWMAVRHRRALIATTVLISVSIGFSTVYLNMHWLSDVVGGWMAGGLVLLALPTVMPTAQRWADALERRVRPAVQRWRARRGHGPGQVDRPGPERPVPPEPGLKTVNADQP
jgi:membrane-associated phospholipid phosphatase